MNEHVQFAFDCVNRFTYVLTVSSVGPFSHSIFSIFKCKPIFSGYVHTASVTVLASVVVEVQSTFHLNLNISDSTIVRRKRLCTVHLHLLRWIIGGFIPFGLFVLYVCFYFCRRRRCRPRQCCFLFVLFFSRII